MESALAFIAIDQQQINSIVSSFEANNSCGETIALTLGQSPGGYRFVPIRWLSATYLTSYQSPIKCQLIAASEVAI